MSKATPQDLVDAGLAPELFGNKNDAAWTTYLQTALDAVALEVEARVGASGYAAADGVMLARLKAAEKYLALGEMWRRRAQFLQAQAMQVRDDGRAPNLVAQALKAAAECEAKGWEQLALVTGDGGTSAPSPSAGVVETGPFSSVAA